MKLNSFAICNFNMFKISKMAAKMTGKMMKFLFSQIFLLQGNYCDNYVTLSM